ncbi:MAG: transcriptional regulator [Tardiphaga sp.]|jgi:transcriptional regulator with XRE-family HTH domain|nr:transcriptional regulator [Tardiphaga sp.]
MKKVVRQKTMLQNKPKKKPPAASLQVLTTGSNAPLEMERKLEKALGAHVRRLRRQKDLSVAGMAEAAGISAGMLSKLENGQISPSLSTLQSIAAALAIPISSLFSEFEDRRDCSFVGSGQGVVIERRGTKAGHVYRLLGHALRGAIAVEPYLIELRKGSAPYTEFRHAGVEFIYMISGKVSYRHDDQVYHLQPGDALMFDSGALHGPQNLKELPATYLSIIIYEQSNV